LIKTTISEFKQKYPKLIHSFEKTGRKAIYHNKITGLFIYWLQQKIKYKDGFNCNICGRDNFKNKKGLNSHRRWHDLPEYKDFQEKCREKVSKKSIKQWHNTKFRERMTGENHPNYGRCGEKNLNWKYNDISVSRIHMRAHKIDPKPKDRICELCEKIIDDKGITKLEHSNKDHSYRMPINPDEWQWIHHSCHIKYDYENNWGLYKKYK